MGKLLDFFEKQRDQQAVHANADDRAQAERVKVAHEMGADIDQLAAKLQKSVGPHAVDDTVVTVKDGAGAELTIEVIEPNPADPETCFRVLSSSGESFEQSEQEEEELFVFLIDWIKARPSAA